MLWKQGCKKVISERKVLDEFSRGAGDRDQITCLILLNSSSQYRYIKIVIKGFPAGSMVKNPLSVQEMCLRSLILEDPTCHRAAKPVCN